MLRKQEAQGGWGSNVKQRKQRLVWNAPNVACPAIHLQVQRSSSTTCSCRVNPSCVMCGGGPTPREDPQLELPTLERLSRLDLGVHPILSFPDGQLARPLPLWRPGCGLVLQVCETPQIMCCQRAESHSSESPSRLF